MDKTKVLKKNLDIVTRQIDDEVVLIPLCKTSDDIDCIYTLNDIGAHVWGLINGKRTLAEIRQDLLEKFDAPAKEIDQKLAEFLKDLEKIKAVT